MTTALRRVDYASRDQKGKKVFYILSSKRKGITLELFYDYWRNVHGPVAARVPGQYQHWQFHVSHNEGGLWPTIPGIEYTCLEEDQFDGIAEVSFESEADLINWFKGAAVLMEDEHNLFSKAIGYYTNPGNSKTYLDAIPTGDPNGKLDVLKFHVMVKKADGVSQDAFHKYLTDSFAPAVIQSDSILKFRLHIFEKMENLHPDIAEVAHYDPPEKQYQAAFEIAFANPLEMETFFASAEYATAVKDQAKYIKQLLPFPERSAHTFVYDGKMTLAGQRSSKVADLIANIGATNQLKEDIVSLMTGKQNGKSGLGHYLQGVQHFGLTVYDMGKAMEFYTEVLGGKVALSGDGFIGPVLHNTLFQKEDIEAIERGIDPKTLGVPNLRDGSDGAIDVRFISFGNTVVEVIHFRDAKLTPDAPNLFPKVSSCVGYGNVPHLSFYVKDDVDLNQFAKLLEEECQRRGLTEVVCNRVIDVKSEAERKNLPLKYNANKFWNEPEYFVEGYSDSEFGDWEGWSLFYCKGPNGEQLEFNQVTRKAKQNFTRAEAEYNQANGTNYWNLNSQTKKSTANGLYATYSIPVNASVETVWEFLLDKMQNPQPYIPYVVEELKILERFEDGILREIRTSQMHMKERIKADKKAGKVTFDVEHPLFTGYFINQVTLPPTNGNSAALPILTYTMDLKPKTDKALEQEEAKWFIKAAQPEMVEQAVLQMKSIVENTTKQEKPMISTTARTKSEIVRQMFQAGESMNVENFVKFYTDDALYQFSNFPIAYGPQGIRDSSVAFLEKVAKVYHHIMNIWEVGETVICEMQVTYVRYDGKVFTLPCCDTIVFKGDKVQELRIYMDIMPVFNTESATAAAAKPEKTSGALIQRVERMMEAAMTQNWGEFMTYFSKDLLYKVGANEPVVGPEACKGVMTSIGQLIKPTTHNIRGTWEFGNVVIVEMDANYVHAIDHRFIQVPCTDIYRFEGDLIQEWRVYPDASQMQAK